MLPLVRLSELLVSVTVLTGTQGRERTVVIMKLTKRIVDAQKPTHKAYHKWDSELSGFGIKTLPSGKTLVISAMGA